MARSLLPPASRALQYSSRLKTAKYTVGWICVLPVEFFAARRLLDEEYDATTMILGAGDENSYVLGRIGKHNVVLNCPAAGTSGELRATKIAAQMKSSFPWIRFVLLVGIGGGVPSRKHDIRLGDVVAGTSVVPLDEGAFTDSGFDIAVKSLLPPLVLRTALTSLEYHLESNNLAQMIEGVATNAVRGRSVYARPEFDRLYSPSYRHQEDCDCLRPHPILDTKISSREDRQDEALVSTHRGLIGSGNSVIKDVHRRNELSKLRNVLCVEMEAAGVMEFTGCLPIRGISDYADGHKNDNWQPYAALAAAVYAKELLKGMNPAEIDRCALDVAGNVLESFIRGALRSATLSSAESSPESAQYVMEGIMERADIVQTLLGEPMESLGDQSRFKPEDFQKVQALHAWQTSVHEALQRLRADVDQQAKATTDYVTREEWEKLEARVTENTSRMESLSSTTKDTLDTTARFMNGLGDHFNKKELHFAATILESAKEYASHLTDLRKRLNPSVGDAKDSRTESPSPSPSKGPGKPSRSAGPEAKPPTPSPDSKSWLNKIRTMTGTGSRIPTPTDEKPPKIPAYRPPNSSSRQQPMARPMSPYAEGHDPPNRSNTTQPRPVPKRPPSTTQPAGSDSSRRASPSGRPRDTSRARKCHTPPSQHTTGGSTLSGTTVSSQNLSRQLNGNQEEPEYRQESVKDIRARFEKQSRPIPSGRK